MRARCNGFSLVEVLTVLAIVGTMMALLLPAAIASRESGRGSVCQNNLKQIGSAILLHHAKIERCPFGGWGHRWVGVPGRGSGPDQPGGWIYNALPYMEESALHELGTNLTGSDADVAYAKRLMTPLGMFVCPSRRAVRTWPVVVNYARSPKPFGQVAFAARSDYAINGGASHVLSHPGPDDLATGGSSKYWRNTTDVHDFSGISHLRTGISLASVDDGTSKTYLVGEKSLDPIRYEDGLSPGDNETMYSGYCTDLHRFAGMIRPGSNDPLLPPLRDSNEVIDPPGFIRFGSAHRDIFYMVNCDGSVHALSYSLDPEVHFRYGHREDRGRPLSVLE